MICSVSEIDWNYYLSIDDQHKLKMYEGYKKLDIVHDEDTDVWTLTTRPGYNQYVEANFSSDRASSKYPIGRDNWVMKDPICHVDEPQYPLAFSMCDFPNEFTCNSGHCIDLNRRCDEQTDCVDGSDEDHCDLLNNPTVSYTHLTQPTNREV